MKPDPTLPCIVCMEPLKNIFPAKSPATGEDWDQINQPDSGITFATYGQYGTTVFDPMDGSFLEINICDDCVKEREAQGGFILHGVPRRTRRETRYQPWLLAKVDE